MTTTATTARERMLLAQSAARSIGLLSDSDKRAALLAIQFRNHERLEQRRLAKAGRRVQQRQPRGEHLVGEETRVGGPTSEQIAFVALIGPQAHVGGHGRRSCGVRRFHWSSGGP